MKIVDLIAAFLVGAGLTILFPAHIVYIGLSMVLLGIIILAIGFVIEWRKMRNDPTRDF